jgi:hypothetical protein
VRGRGAFALPQNPTALGFPQCSVAKKFPLAPAHPERTCWGCDKYCPSTSMACGNGSERSQHPIELYGEGWETWGLDPVVPEQPPQEQPAS